MATYVLVPGAWLGAWAWDEVKRDLEGRGHTVHTVSLTGLGERAHLGGPDVDLEAHIADITGLIESEDLRDVVLVGHSYAGTPVTGAADRAGRRLAAVVYVDSAPLGDGQRMLDLMPPEAAAAFEAALNAGDWRFELPSREELAENSSLDGLSDADLETLRAKASPHPRGTYTQPLRLTGEHAGNPRKAIVACNDFRMLLDAGNPWLASIVTEDWRRFDLETGHWPMFSAAKELTDALDAVGSERA